MFKDSTNMAHIALASTAIGFANKQPLLIKAINAGLGAVATKAALQERKDITMVCLLAQAGINTAYGIATQTNKRVAVVYSVTSLVSCGITYFNMKENIKLHNDYENAIKA